MPPQVEHGNASSGNKWSSAEKFDDPADAALLAAKYMAGLFLVRDPPLPTGWIEDGSDDTAAVLDEFRLGAPRVPDPPDYQG